MNKISNKASQSPIYVVSGGRGVSGNHMVQALLIQYPENNIPVIIVPNIQDEDKIFDVVMKAKTDGGIITHTMVNPEHREMLNNLCKEFGVRVVDFMGPLANYLEQMVETEPLKHPGLYREFNDKYFDRIDAIEFTLSHDDGLVPQKLSEAEIVLTGVSRSGKTPLSIYLGMYGWKVANIPLVKDIPPPPELFKIDPNRVFGLHIGASQLITHRKKRLQNWNNTENEVYINEQSVREEIRQAMFTFDRGGFTVINVTNKPVESSANEILNIMASRFAYRGRRLESPYKSEENKK